MCAKAEAGICTGHVGEGLVGKQNDKGDDLRIGEVAVWFIREGYKVPELSPWGAC